MAHMIDKEKCTGCEACISTCPTEAITKEGDKCKIDPETCVDCGACASVCPVEAISAG